MQSSVLCCFICNFAIVFSAQTQHPRIKPLPSCSFKISVTPANQISSFPTPFPHIYLFTTSLFFFFFLCSSPPTQPRHPSKLSFLCWQSDARLTSHKISLQFFHPSLSNTEDGLKEHNPQSHWTSLMLDSVHWRKAKMFSGKQCFHIRIKGWFCISSNYLNKSICQCIFRWHVN